MEPSAPRTISFTIWGPIARADLSGLHDRVCRLLGHSGANTALCDVHSVAVDAVTVDALARLQAGARRHGCRITLHYASSELRELISFMGLCDVLCD